MPDSPVKDADVLKKFRLAAYVFLGLNLVYFGLVYAFLPPFHIDLSTAASVGAVVVLVLVLAWYLHKGARKLAIVLAIIYAGRILVSAYTLATGEAFAAVPLVLPCLVLTFYFLARAAWDWD